MQCRRGPDRLGSFGYCSPSWTISTTVTGPLWSDPGPSPRVCVAKVLCLLRLCCVPMCVLQDAVQSLFWSIAEGGD